MQKPLPDEYTSLNAEELRRRIADRKKELGERLVILGHHYQSDEVIAFADFRGDSLALSRRAAEQDRAKYIVFCGVHFMAESADILSGPEQVVCLPNLKAGCAMADMADDDDVQLALETLAAETDAKAAPVAYVNSTAAIKALTGRGGGACCTSSNVRNVFTWALTPEADGGAGAEKIFALPDEHLARNTAVAMGHSLEDCAVYDPREIGGGLSAEQIERARFILWRGHCYVHQIFTPNHVALARQLDPHVKVIVHPECPREVVELADRAGSTSQIIEAVEAAAPGTSWAIGTESNLVNRLAAAHPEQSIRVLSDRAALCVQMARIDLPHLLWTLDHCAADDPVNVVTVPEALAADARAALQRMIDIKAVPGVEG